jgi:hypothetical protein
VKGFVRVKMIRGKPRHYLVQSYRDKLTGRPRQRVLAYLGEQRTPSARIAYLNKHLRTWRRQRDNAEPPPTSEPCQYAYQQAERDRLWKQGYHIFSRLERTIRLAEQSLERLRATCDL